MVLLAPARVTFYPGCEKSLKKYLGGSMAFNLFIWGTKIGRQLVWMALRFTIGLAYQRAEDCTNGTQNSTKFSTKCSSLRFIFIDQMSMVSAELLNALDKEVSRMVRKRNSYKLRLDGSERSFGGINLGLLGAFLQIPPASGHSLCSNMILAPTHCVLQGLRLLASSKSKNNKKTRVFENRV